MRLRTPSDCSPWRGEGRVGGVFAIDFCRLAGQRRWQTPRQSMFGKALLAQPLCDHLPPRFQRLNGPDFHLEYHRSRLPVN